MHTFFRVLVVAISCVCLQACDRSGKQKVDEAKRHLATARAYQQQGQWRAAMIEARNAASKGATADEGLAVLADIYMQIGANQAAIELFEKIAKDNLELNLKWVEALLAEGKYHTAQNILLALPEAMRNTSIKYHQLRLKLACTQGEFELAAEQLKSLETLTKQDLHYWRAQIAVAQGDWSQARSLLEQAVAANGQDLNAWILMGQVALVNSQLAEAEKSLSRALALVPSGDMLSADRARVLNLLTEALTRLGRTSEAYQYQKMLAEANPEGTAAKQKFNQALELYQKGDYAQAQTVIAELKKQFPQDKNTNTLLGLVQLQQGDTVQAEALFDAVIDPETAAPRVLQAAALSKIRNQQVDEALALLKEAALAQPKSAEILATYGIALVDKNSKDAEAITWLDKSLAIEKKQPKVYLAKARHFSALGKTNEAIEQLRIAVTLSPEQFEAQQILFQLMWSANRAAEIPAVVDALPAAMTGRKYFWQGWLALQQKNYVQAIGAFEKAVPLSETEKHLPLAGIGQVYQNQEDWPRAFAAWQQVIAAAPRFLAVYDYYLSAAKKLNQIDNALIFISGQSKAEDLWQPNWVLAQWFGANNELDKAINNAELVFQKAAQLPSVKQLLVSLYAQKAQALRQNDLLRSRDWINKALKLQPENPGILTFLVELELADKKISQAQEIIAEYSKGNADPAVVNFLKGLVLQAEGKKSEALVLLQAAFIAQPTDNAGEKIYTLLSQIDAAKAREFLSQWSKALPQSIRPLLVAALDAQKNSDKTAAISAYEAVLAKQPRSVLALNNLAWLYYEARDKRALETAKAAVDAAPDAPEVLDTYGWILVQLGNKAEGVSWLEKAAALAPNIQEITKHLEEAKKR